MNKTANDSLTPKTDQPKPTGEQENIALNIAAAKLAGADGIVIKPTGQRLTVYPPGRVASEWTARWQPSIVQGEGLWAIYQCSKVIAAIEFEGDAKNICNAHNAALDEAVDAAEQEILILRACPPGRVAGEWTPENLTRVTNTMGVSSVSELHQAICDAHNAALAAINEQLSAEIHEKDRGWNNYRESQQQLAAERKRRKPTTGEPCHFCEGLGCKFCDKGGDFRPVKDQDP